MVTSPTTEAEGATKVAFSDTEGARPSTATKRVEGTNFSEYLVISIPLPTLSRAALKIVERIEKNVSIFKIGKATQ
jgi:hypothetical protein